MDKISPLFTARSICDRNTRKWKLVSNHASYGDLKGVVDTHPQQAAYNKTAWVVFDHLEYWYHDAAIHGAIKMQRGKGGLDSVSGHTSVIDWLFYDAKQPFPEFGICTVSAEMNEFIYKKGCKIPKNACMEAALQGHVDALQWLLSKKQPLSLSADDYKGHYGRDKTPLSEADVIWHVANRGRLDVLKVLTAFGHSFDHGAVTAACKAGHLEVFKWLVANKVPWCKAHCVGHDRTIDAYITGTLDKGNTPHIERGSGLADTVAKLREELAAHKAAISKIEAESDSAEYAKGLAEIRTIECQKEMSSQAQDYEGRIRTLTQQIAAHASVETRNATDIAKLMKSAQSKDNEISKWKAHAERLQKEVQTCASGFTAQMAEVQKNYATLEHELATLKATATSAELASATTELEGVYRDKAALQVQVRKLTTERSALNVRLGDVTTCKDELKDLVATLKAQIADLTRPAKDMPLGALLDRAIECKTALLARKPPTKPVHTMLISDKQKRREYRGAAADLRSLLETMVNSSRNVKSLLEDLPVDITWMKAVHTYACDVLHFDWDSKGDFEWMDNATKMVEFNSMF